MYYSKLAAFLSVCLGIGIALMGCGGKKECEASSDCVGADGLARLLLFARFFHSKCSVPGEFDFCDESTNTCETYCTSDAQCGAGWGCVPVPESDDNRKVCVPTCQNGECGQR